MIYLIVLVVTVLATARLTRLVAVDKIMAPLRAWVEKTFGAASKVNYVVSVCFWCLSIWTSAFTSAWVLIMSTGAHVVTWPVALASWLPLTLATSYAASRLLDIEGV